MISIDNYEGLIKSGYMGSESSDMDDLKNLVYDLKQQGRLNSEIKEPCFLLIEEIKTSPEKFSKNFILTFLIVNIKPGCIRINNILILIRLYKIFQIENFTKLELTLINVMVRAIENYLEEERGIGFYPTGNYLGIKLTDTEFDQIMSLLNDVIFNSKESFIDQIYIDFNYLFKAFQECGRVLSFQWMTGQRDPYNESISLSSNRLYSNYASVVSRMIETVYCMYINPEAFDEKSKKKLWIETHAYEKLCERHAMMSLYYVRMLSGQYRDRDTKITRVILPSEMVLYILEFVGLNDTDYELRSGRF